MKKTIFYKYNNEEVICVEIGKLSVQNGRFCFPEELENLIRAESEDKKCILDERIVLYPWQVTNTLIMESREDYEAFIDNNNYIDPSTAKGRMLYRLLAQRFDSTVREGNVIHISDECQRFGKGEEIRKEKDFDMTAYFIEGAEGISLSGYKKILFVKEDL